MTLETKGYNSLPYFLLYKLHLKHGVAKWLLRWNKVREGHIWHTRSVRCTTHWSQADWHQIDRFTFSSYKRIGSKKTLWLSMLSWHQSMPTQPENLRARKSQSEAHAALLHPSFRQSSTYRMISVYSKYPIKVTFVVHFLKCMWLYEHFVLQHAQWTESFKLRQLQ